VSGQNKTVATMTETSKIVLDAGSVKLDTFKISAVGDPRMYANGYQQCKLEILADKQVYNNGTSQWETKPLSGSEIQSMRIVVYSSNANASLPDGWFYDTEKNEFDQGFISGDKSAIKTTAKSKVKKGSKVSSKKMSKVVNLNAPFEVFNRYLRCNPYVVIQPQKFMAVIRLDNGQTYSTISVANQSFVVITPVVPYRYAVKDLLNVRREDAYSSNGIDIDVYYWQLPYNLSIRREVFIESFYKTPKLAFFSDAFHRSSGYKSAVIKSDVTSLTPYDIYEATNVRDPIPLKGNGQYMRALRFTFKFGAHGPDINLNWIIIDNFGCANKFIVKTMSDYNLVELLDG
jgi:hypothetical protein